MPRALVIVNPAAGGGRTARRWPPLRDALTRRGFAFEWVTTTARDSATVLARGAAEDGRELVVAVGGDGTLNEVMNGVMDGSGRAHAVVGAILTGRGRDASRNFGLVRDPRRALERLISGDEVAMDVGVARWPGGRHRFLLNAAGAGFDAVVAERAASGGGTGTVPYLRAVVETVWNHRAREAVIDVDGARAYQGPLTAAVVANGRYFGGGMRIAPAADAADGLLDLVVLGDLGRLELLRWLPSVYRGRHLANPRVSTRPAREIRVEAPAPLPTHVDGEAAWPTPVTFSVCPRALRLRR